MGANMRCCDMQMLLLVAVLAVCAVCDVQGADKYTNENRPYEFGFKIPGEQHREESKDASGIIMGEFGFVTGDGIYHVTVFATDKDGNYKVLSMKHIRVGPSPWGARTTAPPPTTTPPPPPPPPELESEFVLDGKPGCSGCLIPTPGPPGAPTRKPFRVPNLGAKFPLGPRPSGNPFPSSPTGASKPSNPSFPRNPNTPNNGQKPEGAFPANTFPGSGKPNPAFPQGTKPGGAFPANGNTFPGSGKPNPAFGSPRPQGSLPGSGFPNAPNGGNPGSSRPIDGLPAGVSESDVMGLLYKFNYTVGFHGHHESGYRNGDKEGEYYTHFRDGTARKVSYVANEAGYRPKVTIVKLSKDDTPRAETEKEYGLKGYEFKWFNRRK